MREPGSGIDLGRVGSWAFMGFGALLVLVGLVLVLDDPGGFGAIAFGAVFIAIGWAVRRLFAVPAGQKAVAAESFEVATRTWDGRAGTRAQASILHVDADASEAEIDAARAEWLAERWAERPDWVAGRVEADAARTAGLVRVGALLWSVLALGALGAALVWGDIAWLVAAGAGLFALGWIALAVRETLRRHKFGPSTLVLERSPLALGETLVAAVETGVPPGMRLPQGFAIALACVHRWEESHGTGERRRTHRRRETLWHAEARSPGHAGAGDPGLTVPVRFELPADRPPATLGGGTEGILWELTVTAAVAGIDFAASFELPVLAPGQAEMLRRGA